MFILSLKVKLNVGQITNLYTDFKLKHNLQSVFTILTHFTILSRTAMMVPLERVVVNLRLFFLNVTDAGI